MKHYVLKNYSPIGHIHKEVNNTKKFMLGFGEWYGKCYRSRPKKLRFWRVEKGPHTVTSLGKRGL